MSESTRPVPGGAPVRTDYLSKHSGRGRGRDTARSKQARGRVLRTIAVAAAVTAALVAGATGASASPGTVPQAGPARAAAAPVPVLAWKACDAGFQCATARVPLDYRHPRGTKISIAMIKHPATGPGRRLGSLFFNPGGPGESGVAFVQQLYSLFPPAVRARFDIVGFDPRGAGQSTVLRCFASNKQEQQLLGAVEAERYPVGAAQQRMWDRTWARFDRACAAHAGPLLAHDSTADIARDLDLMRRAVGDPALNYLGISHGTYLGATYANLFPAKVRAMVLDGNADPVQWATGTSGSARVLSTLLRQRSDEGSAAALKAFLDLCGRAPARSCAFSAGSPAATRARFATLLRRLAHHPVTLAGTTFTKAVALDTVVNGLYQALPVPNLTDGWSDLAKVLSGVWAATSGGPAPTAIPAPPMGLAAAGGVQPDAGAPYSGVESALGVLCSDSPNPRVPADGYGHTALANPSSCVAAAEDRYFVTGTLPPPGKVCHQNVLPFTG